MSSSTFENKPNRPVRLSFRRTGMVDYRQFRPRLLNTPQYSHLKLLIFWPLFGLMFQFLERGVSVRYHVIYSRLDDLIPFCEYFLIPYLFWFVYLIGMYAYTLFFDVAAFRKLMKFTMITYCVTMLIYIFYPSAQLLRPRVFPRDNCFTQILAWFYRCDTNTNVFPSLHVAGSVAVLAAAWHMPRLRAPGWRIAFTLVTASICASTVFLKQHSILDVIVALALCAVAWPLVYRKSKKA